MKVVGSCCVASVWEGMDAIAALDERKGPRQYTVVPIASGRSAVMMVSMMHRVDLLVARLYAVKVPLACLDPFNAHTAMCEPESFVISTK
eukprot:11255058-Ditylum_brightwellii.AAC.1